MIAVFWNMTLYSLVIRLQHYERNVLIPFPLLKTFLPNCVLSHPRTQSYLQQCHENLRCYKVKNIFHCYQSLWLCFRKRYGSREMLVNEDDFYDTNDLKNFEV
jgi:hypothetical protein